MKPRAFSVNVTQDIINEAEVGSSTQCMIAQAIRLKGATSIHVTSDRVKFNMNGTRYCYDIPPKAALAVIQFDKNPTRVRPFRFTLQGGYTSSVVRRPNAKPRGPTRNRTCKAKFCIRRYHGQRVLVKVGGSK